VRSERCNPYHDADDEEQNLAANTENFILAILPPTPRISSWPLSPSLGLGRNSPPKGPSKDVRLSLPLSPSLGLGRCSFPQSPSYTYTWPWSLPATYIFLRHQFSIPFLLHSRFSLPRSLNLLALSLSRPRAISPFALLLSCSPLEIATRAWSGRWYGKTRKRLRSCRSRTGRPADILKSQSLRVFPR
jgi:hypothetical protein